MRVFAQNLQWVGYHGVYDDERRDGREYSVDVWAEVNRRPQADEIAQTLDYRRLCEVVLEFGVDQQFVLVETLAESILTALLERHRDVTACGVTIRKKASGVPGEPEFVGVTLERSRET